MRDPAREKDEPGRLRQVRRRERHGRGVYKLADMLEGHQDHDRATHRVDGQDSVTRRFESLWQRALPLSPTSN